MSLFAQKPKGPPKQGMPKLKKPIQSNDLTEEVNSMSRKVKLLEDRTSNLHKKTTLSEQNLISYNKRLTTEIKTMNTEMLDLRRMIDELDSKLLLIIKELKLCAKRDEVELVKRYVNLWEPINFVTKREVERIVEDSLDRRSKTR